MRLLVVLALVSACVATSSDGYSSQGSRLVSSKGVGGLVDTLSGDYGSSSRGGYSGGAQVVTATGYSGGGGAVLSGGFSGQSAGAYSGGRRQVLSGGYSGRQSGYRQRGYGCGAGEIQTLDGRCFPATVSRNTYVYESPERQVIYGPPPIIPKGKIRENVLFIRTPEIVGSNDPIYIPPTQTKTTLYVLSKNGQQGQRVVQFADGQQVAPEVFYVHYNDGENPTLPNGQDLQSALSAAGAGLGSSGGALLGGGLGGGYRGVSGGLGGVSGGHGGVSGGLGGGYGGSVSVGFDSDDDVVVSSKGGYGAQQQIYG